MPLIAAAFRRCQGNAVRVKEILLEKHGLDIPYTTLTWLIRKAEIRTVKKKRAGRYHFEPGEEMQHDTSPHKVRIGERVLTAQCSGLTLGFSRKFYMQYYPRFTRFECKIFLTDGFEFMDGTCGRCTIDSTSVIVARGAGPEAVIAPEMEAFGRLYGFVFVPHKVRDPNRKAPAERNFYYAEKNFLPGRSFENWADLNRQAADWCRNVANKKVKRSLRMSPQQAYVMEKPYLKPLPSFAPPIYKIEYRIADVEGYIHLETNRYSVPEKLIGKKLTIHQYWDRVKIYDGQKKVAQHGRIVDKRDARVTDKSHHQPLFRAKALQGPPPVERRLTGHFSALDAYTAELKKRSKGRGASNLKKLLALKQTYPKEAFTAAVEEALQYGLYDLTRLENMILSHVAGDFFKLS